MTEASANPSRAIGQLIQQLREERGWTQAELAERVGLNSQTSIGRKEKGLIRVRPPERKKFAEAFGLSLEEFDAQWRASRIDRTRGGPGIPVINRAPAGQVVDYEEHGLDTGQGLEYLDFGAVEAEHAFAVVVVGDSMEPRLRAGDYLVLVPCDPERPRPDQPRIEDGSIVFVRFGPDAAHEGCALGRFYAQEGGKVRIAKDNPRYEGHLVDRAQIVQLAVAVERREKLTPGPSGAPTPGS